MICVDNYIEISCNLISSKCPLRIVL